MKLATVTNVSDCNSVMEVLKKSKTDWEPVIARIDGVEVLGAPMQEKRNVLSSFNAIIRPDTNQVLGTCTNRYRPNNHVLHLSRLDNLVRQGNLCPEQVSVWDAGHLMAFQFRAPNLDRNVIMGDKISPLLTLAFYNDGKHGDMAFFADFRWACTNQLGKVAKANALNGRAAHRGEVQSKYEDMLMKQIEEMKESTEQRYAAMQDMTQRKLSGKELLKYFAYSLSLHKPEEAVEALLANKEEPKGDARTLRDVLGCYREDDCGSPGSVWQAFNGVTRYVTHKAGRNSATRSARALLGTGQTAADRAFSLACDAGSKEM